MVFYSIYNAVILGEEKGYSNHGQDAGGETYRGISRKYHAGLSIWSVVDQTKIECTENGKLNVRKLNRILADNENLQIEICEFYKSEYYLKRGIDKIENDGIAKKVFSYEVNARPGVGRKALQAGINIAGRETLKIDGKIGPATIRALNRAIKKNNINQSIILKVINGYYFMHIWNSPAARPFLRGLINIRVDLG